MKLPTIISLFTLLLLKVARSANVSKIDEACDCDHHKGGCAISNPPPRGYKCRCLNQGISRCSGTPYDCSFGENCAAGRSSYCACKLGGGDCGGYTDTENIDCYEENSGSYTNEDRNDPDCDCDYHVGGCSIKHPAPKDYKCTCTFRGFWRCAGWAQGCHMNEHCPGNDKSYCACKQGGGDCEAYPQFKTDPHGANCDFSKPEPRKCDCNEDSYWTEGSYTFEDIKYDINKKVQGNPRPEVIATQDIPNTSGVEQTIEFKRTRTVISSSSFSHKSGINVFTGLKFTSLTPLGLLEGTVNVNVTQEYTYGKTTTEKISFDNKFICNGPPFQTTRCKVSVTRADVNVPYTMTLVHNEIENCRCPSNGIWSGITAYGQKLEAIVLE